MFAAICFEGRGACNCQFSYFCTVGLDLSPPVVTVGWLLRICRFGILGAKISFDLVSGGFGFVCKGPCTCPAVPGRVD